MKKKPLPPKLDDVPPDERIPIGGPVEKSKVSLRIFGTTLDPDEITKLLKCQPTLKKRKGEVIPNEKYHLVSNIGSWFLESNLSDEATIEDKTINLLNSVTDDPSVWEKINSLFKVDIFCGIFLKDVNRGFSLSPKVIKMLCERGISIGFDIYYTGEE